MRVTTRLANLDFAARSTAIDYIGLGEGMGIAVRLVASPGRTTDLLRAGYVSLTAAEFLAVALVNFLAFEVFSVQTGQTARHGERTFVALRRREGS